MERERPVSPENKAKMMATELRETLQISIMEGGLMKNMISL
jgi:hypothetical protein